MRNIKGITLISLVITIIIMLILAVVTIAMIAGENGIISNASKAEIITKYGNYKEIIELDVYEDNVDEFASAYVEEYKITSLMYNIRVEEDVQEIIGDSAAEFKNKIVYIGDKIIYIKDDQNEDTSEIENIGYEVAFRSDIEYMIELQMIENLATLSQRYEYDKIGKDVGTIAYPENVYIAGIGYGEGWTVLGDGDSSGENTNIVNEILELGKFDLPDEEKKYFQNSPYIVEYENGYVQSIEGRNTEVGTDEEIWKYTYNYEGDSYVINNLLLAVTEDSVRESGFFGGFNSTIDKQFEYVEDKYGHKGLVTGANAAEIAIEQKNKINNQYSVSIVIEGTTNQTKTAPAAFTYPDGLRYYGKTIFSICNTVNNYTSWISIVDDKLRIYAYSYLTDPVNNMPGYMWIDISEYDNKFMHLQLTVEKGGQAKLYINGDMKAEFDSGSKEFENTTLTIGDLRAERNLRYVGTIYDVALYGKVLTEEEAKRNWKYVQKEYNIDNSGTQN